MDRTDTALLVAYLVTVTAGLLRPQARGYNFSRVPLTFYSYFRSDRHRVLFHPLGGGWRPFRCPAIIRALDHAHGAPDRTFLEVLAQH